MNEQWRQQLKEIMADYRRPAPDVSWEKIDQILDARKARKPWLWHIAAAVAVVLIITGVGYWINQQSETKRPPLTAKTENTDRSVKAVEAEAPLTPIAPIDTIRPIPFRNTIASSKVQLQDTIVTTQAGDLEITDSIAIIETTETSLDTFSTSPTKEENIIPFIQRARGRSLKLPDNRLATKVYFTNNLSSIHHTNTELSTANNNSNGHVQIVDPTPSDSDFIDTIHTRRVSPNNQNIHYHQPVRLGISLRYQLNDNWSIESGLLYTLLVADVNNIEQRHSYIGVPINIGYQLLERRHFGLYLSAGGVIEKMLDANPWQLSLNFALGVEYKLSERFCLYAEPGGGYYFSNKSSIPTIYQDHPFNFNLNIGLRFNLK